MDHSSTPGRPLPHPDNARAARPGEVARRRRARAAGRQDVAALRAEVAALRRDADERAGARDRHAGLTRWLVGGLLVFALVLGYQYLQHRPVAAARVAYPAPYSAPYTAPAIAPAPRLSDYDGSAAREQFRQQEQICDALRRAYDAQVSAYDAAQARGEGGRAPARPYC